MAEHLKLAFKREVTETVLFAGLLFLMVPSFAQGVPDPTRPPAAVLQPNNENDGVDYSGPVLQSVLISPARVQAIISGQTVKVGDKFGEAKVVKITENEVVLRTGKDMQVLKLFPTIDKKRSGSSRNSASANSR